MITGNAKGVDLGLGRQWWCWGTVEELPVGGSPSLRSERTRRLHYLSPCAT